MKNRRFEVRNNGEMLIQAFELCDRLPTLRSVAEKKTEKCLSKISDMIIRYSGEVPKIPSCNFRREVAPSSC